MDQAGIRCLIEIWGRRTIIYFDSANVLMNITLVRELCNQLAIAYEEPESVSTSLRGRPVR